MLVEEKKLATDAGASYDGYARDAGEFSVYAVPRPGVSLEQLEKAVDQVLKGYASALPNASDLSRAKTQLVACVTYRRDSQFAMAAAYGQALTIGLTVDDVNDWPARIRAVTAEGGAQCGRAGIDSSDAKRSRPISRPRCRQAPHNEAQSRFPAPDVAALMPALGAALAVNVKTLDLGKKAQVWFAEDHTVPIIAMTARCRPARPMIRRARPGWPPSRRDRWTKARAI